jgi:hypothetical protein
MANSSHFRRGLGAPAGFVSSPDDPGVALSMLFELSAMLIPDTVEVAGVRICSP